MPEEESDLIPLAVLGVPAEAEPPTELPLAYIPRLPGASTYRELIERAVNWGRR